MDTTLIDTYVAEIGRHLRKNKGDIEKEIRSALQDILDEHSTKTGKPIDQEMILSVLQEYGSPEKVAASYQGEQYLIGPKLYPAYIRVIKIVLPLAGVLALIGLGFSLFHQGSSDAVNFGSTLTRLVATFSEGISSFLGAMITALGGITVAFAVLEQVVPDFKLKEDKWQASSLLKISKPETISQAGLIVDIFLTSLAIVIFNFFPQVVGFTPSLNGIFETGTLRDIVFIPFLSETFLSYIPYLTGLWILTIILDGILIQRGRWETWTRWFSVAVKGLVILLVGIMLAGPSLVTVSADSLVASGIYTRDVANILAGLTGQGIRLALVLTIIFGGLDMIKGLYRILRTPSVREKSSS